MLRIFDVIKKVSAIIIPSLIVLIGIEVFSNAIYYIFREGKCGFPFNRLISTSKKPKNMTNIYELPWDTKTGKMKPGVYKTHEGVTYTINSRGFRTREFHPYKKNGLRIICFGGSSTMGIESADNQTYPFRLEELITNHGIKCEVLNFGFSSKSLIDIRNLFFTEAIQYKPDIITIFSNRNTVLYDSNIPDFWSDRINTSFGLYMLRLNILLEQECMTYNLLNAAFSRIRKIVTYVSQSLLHSNEPNNALIDINDVFFRNGYENILESIIKHAHLNGIHVVLIKQPLYIDPALQMTLERLSWEELLTMLKDKNYIPPQDKIKGDIRIGKMWMLSSAILNKKIDEIKEKSPNVLVVDPIIDFLGPGVDYEKLFHDYVHLLPAGNELLAHDIFFSIKDLVIKLDKNMPAL